MTPLRTIEAHLTAELERLRWIPWSGPEYDEDVHPAPPDETDVLFFIQTGLGNRIEIGQISKRCGTWGPSLATHWRPLPELPWSEKCPECDGAGVIQKRVAYSEAVDAPCEDCGGRGLAPGRSPAITAAESALKLCREERKRVERLVGWLERYKDKGNAMPVSYNAGFAYCARLALAEYNAPVKEETDAG